MKLNVAAELKLPGKVGESKLSEPFAEMEYMGRPLRFLEPITLEVSYVYDGKGFSVRGVLTSVLDSQCARCAKNFAEPLSINFDERFVRGMAEEDEDSYAFEGEVLDLSEMVRDNILLHLPIASVCSEDCQGLCPICGCNLNTAQCSCKHEEQRKSPLSALEQLLKDDKEV